MTHHRLVLEVARWEFRRFFKPRQQVVSLLLTIAVSIGGYAATKWLDRSGRDATIALLDSPEGFTLPADAAVRIVARADRDRAAARRDVEAGVIDGALLFTGPDSAVLVVRGTPPWIARLDLAVSEWRRRQRFNAAGLEPAVLAALSAPVRVTVDRVGRSRAATRAARGSAIALGALMMMGIWLGLGYMFVGITGEKQARVTEQLLTAISPGAWMDGKVVGLSAVAAVSTAGYVASGIVLASAARWAGIDLPLPAALGASSSIAVMVVLALLGFAFWNTFIAGIAALVNDPHTSSRGGFLMLPLLPVAIAMLAIREPDTVPMRLLSMFPPTAPPVLLTRLVVGNVAWWELAVAVTLLALAIWGLRVAAERVFRTSLLMYGKEATWREVWRWVRAGS